MGQAGLEEHRVHPKLCVQERHVAVHLDKKVDTLVPLVKVRVIVGQGLRAPRASKSPPRCHLEMGEKEQGENTACQLTESYSVAEPAPCPPWSCRAAREDPQTQHTGSLNSNWGLRCVTTLNRQQRLSMPVLPGQTSPLQH